MLTEASDSLESFRARDGGDEPPGPHVTLGTGKGYGAAKFVRWRREAVSFPGRERQPEKVLGTEVGPAAIAYLEGNIRGVTKKVGRQK